ncbi:MAG: rod shape-determining protein MreC [Paracoccaceae bacterium]|nr:rod shape-determining protein MreC [Paracoccaceae bacterium]
MAQDQTKHDDYVTPIRRLLVGCLVVLLLGIFLMWRIDNPRVERLRANVIDAIIPRMDWAMAPVTAAVNLARDFRSYKQISQQNQELRKELKKMKIFKEAARQLEEENARLLDLNKLKLDPKLTEVSGIILADSGSPFNQSVLLNVGHRDGIQDGWAAMDGLGLVGRIFGIGENTSRVILLTDISSRIPVIIEPSGQNAFVSGDNSIAPVIDFLEDANQVRPGDRIVTSGRGGVLPPDLLLGHLAVDTEMRLRVRLAADYERLEFVRVLRDYGREEIKETGQLIAPEFQSSDAPSPNEGGR